MKFSGLFLVVVMLMSTLTFESCSKYEEGPNMSLRSKKARLANTWKIDKTFKNGVEETWTEQEQDYFSNSTWTFDKDNTLVIHYEWSEVSYSTVIDVTWTWAFSDDDMEILFTSGKEKSTVTYLGQTITNESDLSEDENWKLGIIKLMNKELKLKDLDAESDDVYSTAFIPV